MTKPVTRVRGIRSPIPSGYVLGRTDAGSGPPAHHKVQGGLVLHPTLGLIANFTGDATISSSGVVTVSSINNGTVILPTSATGLPSGALWNNAGTVTVVP